MPRKSLLSSLRNAASRGALLVRCLCTLAAFLLAAGASGWMAAPAAAQSGSVVVTSTADSGAGSLRQAVLDVADGGVITFSLTTPATITLTSQITVDKDLTITGLGETNLIISGNNATRIFLVTAGTLRLSQLTLQNGRMQGQHAVDRTPGAYSGLGGAVFVSGGAGLTATNVTFRNNNAIGGNGGNSIYDSEGDDAGFYGGGGGGAGGAATVDGGWGGGGGGGYDMRRGGTGGFGAGGGGSTGSNSGAGSAGLGGSGGSGVGEAGFAGGGGGGGMGGAIYIDAGGAAGLRNSTFTNNRAQGGNGGAADALFSGGGGGGGAGLGSAIFSNGSLCIQAGTTFSANSVLAGAAGAGRCGFGGTCPSAATAGQALDSSAGVYEHTSSDHSCSIWSLPPTALNFAPVSLEENRPANTPAGTFSTVDPDVGDTFTYTLVSGAGSTDNASFHISGNQLLTSAALDYETRSTYNIRVRSTDSGGRWIEAAFSVTISNVNDAPTAVTLSNNHLLEAYPVGTTIGLLTVADQDNPPHSLALVDGGAACPGTDNAAFSISGNQLSSAQVFNYETRSSYAICVRATDSGSPALSLDQALTILIDDANEPPTAISLSNASLPENQPAASAVGTFSTTDPDPAQTHTYSLVSGGATCPGTDNAAFSISGAELRAVAAFDYESQSNYGICVRSTDSGAPAQSIDRPFTITITDANEAPDDIALSSSSVEENLPAGTLVGALTATDPDPGQSHVFAFLDGDPTCPGADNAAFSISGAQLYTAAAFDYESQPSYAVCIQATDDGSPAAGYAEAFTIQINDRNDAPTGISLSNSSLPENQPAGSAVSTLSTTDPDLAQTHAYSLVDGGATCPGTDNAAFSISGDQLSSAAIFDFETRASYAICVRSTDSGSPALSFDQAFTILIDDGNDAPTGVNLSNASLPENQPAGSAVGTLSTTDPDLAQTHAYSLVDGGATCPGTDNAAFSISGDQLSSAAIFDFETDASYAICVRATDSGSPAQSIDRPFTITITDENEAPDDIALSSSSIEENSPTGTLVGALSVTDPDAGQSHVFSFRDGDAACPGADNAAFSISGAELRTAAVFDYESRSSYAVCIQVMDDGIPAAGYAEAFTIQINDRNEAPTGINLSSASLPENQPAGTLVGTLSAVDAEIEPHTFALVDGGAACPGPDNAAFSISGDQLSSAAVFDFETRASYAVCIRAADSATPAGEVLVAFTLTVTNINEPPIATGSLPDQNVYAGLFYQYILPATFFQDPENEPLTYTAALQSGDPLPAWLTFDAAARELRGTPLAPQVLEITLTARDPGGLDASDTFTLTIVNQPGNHPPVVLLGIPNTVAHAATPFSFTFPVDSFIDYDGDPLTYQAQPDGGAALPAWLSFDPLTRTFSGTPAAADAGLLVLRVTVFDGRGGQASTTFQLAVDANVAPSLLAMIPDQVARLGLQWNYTLPAVTFGDANGDELRYSATLADGSPLPGWLSFNAATRAFRGTPPTTGAVAWNIRVTAAESAGTLSATDEFFVSPWSARAQRPGVLAQYLDAPGAGPVDPPLRTTRLHHTLTLERSYAGAALTAAESPVGQVCYGVASSDSLLAGGNLGRLALGAVLDGVTWSLLETRSVGGGMVCADATPATLYEVFLLPASPDDGSSGLAAAQVLPATGFAPARVTALPRQPARSAYTRLGDVWLEIPALNQSMTITGVPQTDGGWDISWLGQDAGWLEGSDFPGTGGNAVLTGHVTNAQGAAGPFARLGQLAWGQQIIVHAFGVTYTYEVRTVSTRVTPENVQALRHEEHAWLTLITCQGYDEASNSYRWRTVVRAVLVSTGKD